MNIWLINPYGPLPGEGWRETRFASLGRALAERGHHVLWWTANFSHHSKQVRSTGWGCLQVSEGFRIELVPTCEYRRHVGLRRLIFELRFAAEILRECGRRVPPPALILSADATMAWGAAAAYLAKRLRAKLVIDIIDLWPEVFETIAPLKYRRFVSAALAPLYWLRRQILGRAVGITAVSDSYLAVAKTARGSSHKSCKFETVYWGCPAASKGDPNSGVTNWRERLPKGPSQVFAIYAGTLGENYDIATLVQAATSLSTRGVDVTILVAGGGPRAEQVREFASNPQNTNLMFLGEVNPADLRDLYRLCDIGLCLYAADSLVAMPIKFFDYAASGLPMVSSLDGDIARYLEGKGMGLKYRAGDANSLADAIGTLASDACLRLQMADRSRAAAQVFDHDVQYRNFARFLEAVGQSTAAEFDTSSQHLPATTTT